MTQDKQARLILMAFVQTQTLVEQSRPVPPQLASRLLTEIVRQRRLIQAQETKIRRLEDEIDRLCIRCARRSKGAAKSESDIIRREAEDVDSIDC